MLALCPYCLLLAGVQTVLAPRWPVYDDANLFAMRHFYAALASGDPVHVAYQKMRLALRGSARFSHPRYWASWALFAPGPN